jgi:hypothetical protein
MSSCQVTALPFFARSEVLARRTRGKSFTKAKLLNLAQMHARDFDPQAKF